MSTDAMRSTRYSGSTRVDVTEYAASRIPERIEANAVAGTEVYLERRGGRTYLVTDAR
ncbi:hypothetical protein ACERIT_13420 [Halopenitus sp. H-Gu1]|uniref:hypothetical protein n=1 Tax=Halopenitus sp. H-Gu1 TaxID=3242697 RepID=UPI00359E243E